MQYKILASDYDNTLMPFGEAKPRPAVVKAVKKLQAAGGKFVLSTGRSYPGIRDKNQLGGIRYDYAITCNGACVVDRQGNVIAEHPLTSEEMYVLVDFCEDYNYPLQFNFRDAYYAYCEYEYLHTGYQMMNSPGLDCVDGEDQDRHLLDMPHAAFAAMPPQEVERFHEKYGYLGLHWMQTGAQNADGYCYYDIVRGGMDKGVGLADLCGCGLGCALARQPLVEAEPLHHRPDMGRRCLCGRGHAGGRGGVCLKIKVFWISGQWNACGYSAVPFFFSPSPAGL